MTRLSEDTQGGEEQETTAVTTESVCELQSSTDDDDDDGLNEHMKCNVIPFGLQLRAGYVHGKAYSDLMGVTYDGRMKQFILLDSKGVTTWNKDAVRKKGVRSLNFGQFQHRSITSIVYGRNMNIYFALGKDFDLMVLNRDFQQTCKVSSQLRSVVFMIFNPVTNELITGGVGGTKIWKYEQLTELTWNSLTPMSNYQLVLKRELPDVGGSWVKQVDLDERLQQLYCCSSMDIHAYRMDGTEVFTFIRHRQQAGLVIVSTSEKGLIGTLVDQGAALGAMGGHYGKCFCQGPHPGYHRLCLFSHCTTPRYLSRGHNSGDTVAVKVWNIKGGWIHTFHGHSRAVTNLLLHPECHATAVTSSLDGSVRMWSLHTLEPLYSVVLSSDGIMWMGLMDDNLLYLSTLRELTVWSLNHVTDFWALTRCPVKHLSLAHSVGKSTCVTAIGDDSRKLSTVLPPPGLSPMAQILCVTFNRAAKVIYLLLNTKVIWVYTTRTDPACRLYVWDIISIQEELSHEYNYQLTAGCSNPFVNAQAHTQTLVSLVECHTICYLESPVVMQTPAGQCCPLRDNFLLMGLEDGRVLFMDPLVRAKQHVLLVADKDAVLELRHDISHNMLVTRCDKREVTVIQFWSLPYLQCLTEFVCPLDMTGFIRLNTTLITAHEDGSVVRHCLLPPDVSTAMESTTRPQPKPPASRTILKCGHFDRVADHPGPVIAIDVSVQLSMFCTASADGTLKVWDEKKCLLTEITVDETLTSICFLNNAGDLLLGYRNHIFIIGHRRVCPYWKGSHGDSDDDEDVSLFEADIYEDPAIKFDQGAGRDSPEPVTLQNYLVPYDLAFGKKVTRGPSLSDLTDRDDLSSLDLASDWESELDPAETDTYMSPKEGSDSLHLIDLTLSREVTAFDLAIHAAAAKKHGKHSHKHDRDKELDFDLPNFGISPGPTPTPSTPSTLRTPSSIVVSEGGESSSSESAGEEQEELSPQQTDTVHPTVAPPTNDVVKPLSEKPFQSRLSQMTIDSKSLMRQAPGKKTEAVEEKTEPVATPLTRTASLGQIKKKDMKSNRQLPRRAISQPSEAVRKENLKSNAVKHHKPKAKQQPVKSVRQLPVASVTDNVATKANWNVPEGGAVIRRIPTSSMMIKPKTGYSYSGPADNGAKRGSVAKPQRTKQLIQVSPAKRSSGKGKKTTCELSPGVLLPPTPIDRAASSMEVKMYAVIGELKAPSVSLISELTDNGVVEKAQYRSILTADCSSPLTRFSDGVAFSVSERDEVTTPGGASITSAGQMAPLSGDMSLRPDSGTVDFGRTSRNLLNIEEVTDGKATPGLGLHDLTASPTIYSDYGSDWTFPAQQNVEAWYRANAQQMQDGLPQGKYLGGRAVTCGTPSGRPNTPAEERARAWRPYTAGEIGEPNKEELERDFLEALRRYRGSVMSACRDNLHQNDGTVFGEDWQEREIERHQLLRMQRQLRAKSAAEKRAGVDKEKRRRQTTLPRHTSCAPPGDCNKTAEVDSDLGNPDGALNQDANVAAFISILEHSRSATAFGMAPESDQSHDMKRRPYTAAPTVHSHAHRANMLPNDPEGTGYMEHSAKYMAVDKRDRSAETPFRGRISMVPCGQLFSHLTSKDIDIKQFNPRNPASSFQIQSSKSIPNRCSRYILVRRPCASAQQVATPLEEQLILERFPHLQHQWLGDGGCFRRARSSTLSHQPLLMHHQKLINQMREIQRRLTEGATK